MVVGLIGFLSVALGLVSVSPDPFRAGGCLVGNIEKAGLIGGCPVWVSRFCLWWFCRSLRVVFAVVLIAFCVGGRAAYCVRVVCGSVVRLPLVWVGGVLSGLHPPPFHLSVFGVRCSDHLHPFSICDN